ncbi:hypothetical protein F5878DRAFT_665902 [Lentinula raphanica]|uniref:Uncharacterized protein n=1 Tax=Lentinula raphanica TaxID=153919 RepID=A0AA38NYU0_9AGAR|nr:hypothetical protein F5878DRAFT_665902 [Lentinula raphanica]
MPRGPRSHSTPPSSSSSSSAFGRGKTSTVDPPRSASANSSPTVPFSENQCLERVEEEASDGDDASHPPSSALPSGTTAQSLESSGGSPQGDSLNSGSNATAKDSTCPTSASGSQHSPPNQDPAVTSATAHGSTNPLYAVLRSLKNVDELSVRSPGDNVQPPCPPVTAASSSPAGGGDTGVPLQSEPSAHDSREPSARAPSPRRQRDSQRESSARGRSPHRRSHARSSGRLLPLTVAGCIPALCHLVAVPGSGSIPPLALALTPGLILNARLADQLNIVHPHTTAAIDATTALIHRPPRLVVPCRWISLILPSIPPPLDGLLLELTAITGLALLTPTPAALTLAIPILAAVTLANTHGRFHPADTTLAPVRGVGIVLVIGDVPTLVRVVFGTGVPGLAGCRVGCHFRVGSAQVLRTRYPIGKPGIFPALGLGLEALTTVYILQ